MYKKIVIIAIILIPIVLVLGHNRKSIQSNISKSTLLPQKESFTELYFPHTQNLNESPKIYEGKEFTYSIHNLENKDMNYDTEVYLEVDKRKVPIVRRNIFIKNGGEESFTENFSSAFVNKKFKVVVNLVNKNEEISFWVNE